MFDSAMAKNEACPVSCSQARIRRSLKRNVWSIGVRAVKFLGVRRIFAQICSKKLWATFCANILSWRHIFRMTSKKELHVLLGRIFAKQTRWAPFLSQKSMWGAIFVRISRDFAQIFMDFAYIFTDFAHLSTDFARIFTKSKLLGVRL